MLFSALFPSVCGGCGALGPVVCAACAKRLKTTHPTCLGCASFCEAPDFICTRAPQHERKTNFSFWQYTNTLAELVIQIKYKGSKETLRGLLEHISPNTLSQIKTLLQTLRNPALVPIPLHPKREKERGFNQALLIANALSVITGLPVVWDGIARTKHTNPQAKTTSREERLKNMEGAFVPTGVCVTRITPLIVDDVVTTGATIRVAARALGIKRSEPVYSICLAREELSAGGSL